MHLFCNDINRKKLLFNLVKFTTDWLLFVATSLGRGSKSSVYNHLPSKQWPERSESQSPQPLPLLGTTSLDTQPALFQACPVNNINVPVSRILENKTCVLDQISPWLITEYTITVKHCNQLKTLFSVKAATDTTKLLKAWCALIYNNILQVLLIVIPG